MSEPLSPAPDEAPGRAALNALDGSRRGNLAGLGRRVYLTYRYRGLRALLYRALTFPLRFTPLRARLRLDPRPGDPRPEIPRWHQAHGTPVSIVIPSYRDAEQVAALVDSVRRTTDRRRVEIIVSDDASGSEHLAALRRIDGIRVIQSAENTGFAATVNRGLRAAHPARDVVILNSDMEALPGWLACLQYAASRGDDIGIVGAKLLYRDGRIQFGGTVRNREAPEWFDHRFRFRPADWGPAGLIQPVLAVTGACMYVRRAALDRIGPLDEAYPMAYEDVDWCLRAWQAGYRVIYFPEAQLIHDESATRGTEVRERERTSQQVFWARWGAFFDQRDVRSADGALRVIYVTEDTGVGGGHRDIFEHLNGLRERGHEAELWSLGGPPSWFQLEVPVRTFPDYDALVEALAPVPAIKVATWWNTASPVWAASVLNGIPVYFVQDIETSYYPDDPATRAAVLASYRHEFRYMTISAWNRERLRELGLDAVLIPPGIDLENFRPLPDRRRRRDMVLALGRSNPLKNLPLTIAAWRSLPEPRPELCLFGIEPQLADGEPGIRYIVRPSDEEVNRLLNEATVFIQTSRHEGFCLPPLESMATGGAVVCTDAHGNRDFCRDGENCLMPDAERHAVAAALQRVLADEALRDRLGRAGRRTAADYAWARRLDTLVEFFEQVAEPRRIAAATGVVPAVRRAPR